MLMCEVLYELTKQLLTRETNDNSFIILKWSTVLVRVGKFLIPRIPYYDAINRRDADNLPNMIIAIPFSGKLNQSR